MKWGMHIGGAACWLVSACSVSFPTVEEGKFICTVDAHCPERWGCGIDRRCYAIATIAAQRCDVQVDGALCQRGPGEAGICIDRACQAPRCGDGFITASNDERCDAGARNSDVEPNACRMDCTIWRCGDGVVDAGEACDDGNTQDGDGCRGDCGKVEVCGDAVTDAGEACDDGNENPVDGCDRCVATEWRSRALIGGGNSGARITAPCGVAVDRLGNLYVADSSAHRVFKVFGDTGRAKIIAGTGMRGSSGDGGPASSARMSDPCGVAVDGLGNIYVADRDNNRIRMISAETGLMQTVAGNGTDGSSGDGGEATRAQLSGPVDVAVDGLGNIYVADAYNRRIRMISAASGSIYTIAGTGRYGFSGDGGAATDARITDPSAIAVDDEGNIYFADEYNNRIRMISADTRVMHTVAGTGTQGFSGDGGPATGAELDEPTGVAVDELGNIYVADSGHHRLRMISASTGIIRTIAGTSERGFSGDGGPATSARLLWPRSVAVDGVGNVYFAESLNGRVRHISADTGIIRTVAGTGIEGLSGDGGAGTSAQLRSPRDVALDGRGNAYVADMGNNRICSVSLDTGVIRTLAGMGTDGFSGDGGVATQAEFSEPTGVAVDGQGNVYVADKDNQRIRMISAETGVIRTIAGTGAQGFSGDGGLATEADLDAPWDVAVDAHGNVYVADTYNRRIRMISADTGIMQTLAGTGVDGFSGDGGAATLAQLSIPTGVAVDRLGNVYVSDSANHRVRMISPDTGVIQTIAGTGEPGSSGDGGAAVNAQLAWPTGVAVDGLGNVYVTDQNSARTRRVSADTGVIHTIAGTGTDGFSGDGGAATDAQLAWPSGVAVDGRSNVYIVDGGNDRVRVVSSETGVITTMAGRVDPSGMGPIAQARLGSPRGVAPIGDDWLFAGGASGTVQISRRSEGRLQAVVGRYPQPQATGNLARYRHDDFGDVGGVAVDEGGGLIYLTESNRNRLHIVTVAAFDSEAPWTIADFAGDAADGAAGHVDGPAASARFRQPTGLHLVPGSQVLYVADTGNHVIRAIDLSTGEVSTVFGMPETLGFFGDGGLASEALLYRPEALTRCANGDFFIADTGNNRVRRVHRTASSIDIINTVLGDGTPASSGEGFPALTFPVEQPRGLACDGFGNLYVTSTRTIRLLLAGEDQAVDGQGAVRTVYGRPPRTQFPATVSHCLADLYVTNETHVFATDACEGLFIELWSERAVSPEP